MGRRWRVGWGAGGSAGPIKGRAVILGRRAQGRSCAGITAGDFGSALLHGEDRPLRWGPEVKGASRRALGSGAGVARAGPRRWRGGGAGCWAVAVRESAGGSWDAGGGQTRGSGPRERGGRPRGKNGQAGQAGEVGRCCWAGLLKGLGFLFPILFYFKHHPNY